MTMDRIDTPAERPEILMSRVFDAPRALVWQVLTTPKHVARWFGGEGFENPVCEMDLRPGGIWRHVMRTPDGSEFPLEYEFVEIAPPERLVWRGSERLVTPTGAHATPEMTVTLEDLGARTRWTMVAKFASDADRAVAMKMGFTMILGQGTDKFAAIVRALAPAALHA